MANSLDLSPQSFKDLLDESTRLVLEKFENLEEKKAYHDHIPGEVASWFDEGLPEEGMESGDLLSIVDQRVLKTATNNMGPHMYAYVMAGGTQMSIIAEKLAATINQNVGKWHLSPAINEIEKRVVRWGGEMIGYPDAAGVLVSGGSAANMAGLTVARNIFFEKEDIRQKGLFGQRPMVVYASTEVHGCVDKSVDQLGIGTDYLRKIETNSDFTINTEALERTIRADLDEGLVPFCIIGSAGTVNTGAIDDLDALADISAKYGLWFHVDGAYGAIAATLDSIRDQYNGMEGADSIAMDFHKWLYQPFEGGCLLVKDWSDLKRTYFKEASYLNTSEDPEAGRLDFNEHYFQLSRNAKALKIWMTLKFYGMRRIREMIQKDIDLAKYLAEQVDQSEDFELKSTSSLAITCFRFTAGLKDREAIANLNKRLIPALEKDGRVFIMGTLLHGEFVIRACLINHRMHQGTVDHLLTVIREVGAGLT